MPTEKVSEDSALDLDVYQKPDEELDRVIDRIVEEIDDALKADVRNYINRVRRSENKKDDQHQVDYHSMNQRLISAGNAQVAGLVTNIHRILTEFSGYGANDRPSPDVATFLADELNIPDQGVILLKNFVVQDLPSFLEKLEAKGVDLTRVRVHVPLGMLAASFLGMSESKSRQVKEALEKLNPDQIVCPDENDVHEIPENYDEIALVYAPRVMAVIPTCLDLQSEADSVERMREFVRYAISSVVEGGRVLLNVAFGKIYSQLQATLGLSRGKDRQLAKLSGICEAHARAMLEVLEEEGFHLLTKESEGGDGLEGVTYIPEAIDPTIDHILPAGELHAIKQAA